MSRSNPTDNSPNPCTRWFEWDGSAGSVRYYDKETKKNVDCGKNFSFILLDELATIKGWHNRSDSGIHSNEVKDTLAEPFVVKCFAGDILAKGIYRDIRDKVGNLGGVFATNCYIAYKEGEELKLGSIYFKGDALHAWVEFKKANRKDVYAKSVQIKGSKYGKVGKIEFETPIFFTRDIAKETDEAAIEIDRELQNYLEGYFKRTRVDQAQRPQQSEEDFSQEREPERGQRSQQSEGRGGGRQQQQEEEQQPPKNWRRGDPDPDLDVEESDIPF